MIAVVAAAVVLAVAWLRTRPARPEVGPLAMSGGDETPALVDLLTGGFRVEDDAVPATVVDLAARRWFDIELVGGGNVIVRLRTGRDDLTRYEQRVRRHVERRAVDGVAPAAALTLGPEGVSKRWWKGFVREVNRHGRELGLCRRRWDFAHLAMIWAPVVVAGALVALTGGTADRIEADGGWGEPGLLILAVTAVAVAGLAYVARSVTRSDAQAPTDAGLAAAGRWLGVREYLSDTGSFDEASAASVAIWERQLAYATAMGLAPVVQRELPFEVEHDRHAWSRATGHWRRVRIRYLSLRPGWGLAPWTAAIGGAVQSLFLGAAAWVGLSLARESWDTSSLPDGFRDWLPVIGLIGATLALTALVWTATKTLFGLVDLVPRRTIEGELVRRREFRSGHRLPRPVQWMMWSGRDEHGMRRDLNRRTRYHLAVDDGSSARIIAYRARPEVFRRARQGARVALRVSPRLGYVSELDELAPPPRTEGAVAHELVEDAAGRATGAVAAVMGRLGNQLQAIESRMGAGGAPALDEVDESGVSVRERLAEAQTQIAQLRGVAATGPRSSDGTPLLGGMVDGLASALGRIADAGEPTDGSPRRPEEPDG